MADEINHYSVDLNDLVENMSDPRPQVSTRRHTVQLSCPADQHIIGSSIALEYNFTFSSPAAVAALGDNWTLSDDEALANVEGQNLPGGHSGLITDDGIIVPRRPFLCGLDDLEWCLEGDDKTAISVTSNGSRFARNSPTCEGALNDLFNLPREPSTEVLSTSMHAFTEGGLEANGPRHIRSSSKLPIQIADKLHLTGLTGDIASLGNLTPEEQYRLLPPGAGVRLQFVIAQRANRLQIAGGLVPRKADADRNTKQSDVVWPVIMQITSAAVVYKTLKTRRYATPSSIGAAFNSIAIRNTAYESQGPGDMIITTKPVACYSTVTHGVKSAMIPNAGDSDATNVQVAVDINNHQDDPTPAAVAFFVGDQHCFDGVGNEGMLGGNGSGLRFSKTAIRHVLLQHFTKGSVVNSSVYQLFQDGKIDMQSNADVELMRKQLLTSATINNVSEQFRWSVLGCTLSNVINVATELTLNDEIYPPNPGRNLVEELGFFRTNATSGDWKTSVNVSDQGLCRLSFSIDASVCKPTDRVFVIAFYPDNIVVQVRQYRTGTDNGSYDNPSYRFDTELSRYVTSVMQADN